MKDKFFHRIIQSLEVLVLILIIASIYSCIQFLFQKPSVVVTKPVVDTTDWLVEKNIEKPVVGFINAINPEAKVEFEKFDIPKESPINNYLPTSKNTIDSFDTSLNLYRKKITLDTKANQIPLTNYVISISMDVLILIRESKVSFTCEQIYFTDEDGKTVISHWIEKGCGKESTKFWIRIPTIKPKTKKNIYMYYGNDTKYTYSNFKTTFLPEKDLIGWYYFNDPITTNVFDFSGSGNHGSLSTTKDDSGWYWWKAKPYEEKRPFLFFNDWKTWKHEKDNVFFTLSSPAVKDVLKKGSIEVWIKMYTLSEQITQHIMVDSYKQIYIGILPGGSIFLQNGSNSNRILWDTRLEKGKWFHFVCTLDFSRKSINVYVNGNQIKQFPQKVPFIWTQSKSIGHLEFGGYHTADDEFGYAGFLDSLRIYNKKLQNTEVVVLSKINQEALRFPKLTLSKEEKVSAMNQIQEKINFADLTEFSRSEKVKINLLYASPYNLYYNWEKEYLKKIDPILEPPMIIDRFKDEFQPIFGFESHFYSYLGTQVSVTDDFLLSYVGIKINDPSLIKDLKISYAWSQEEFISYEPWSNIKNFFIPSAFACGPGYSYKNLGDSQLVLCSVANGILWYKLIKPIFINPTVSIMQLGYKPTTKVGILQIQLVDMLFINEGKKLIRPIFFTKDPAEIAVRRHGPEKLVFPSQYKAAFLPIEKGFIDFQRNKESGLDLVISNLGYDKISLSYDVFQYWQENLFVSIQIFNNNKQQIMNITVEDIKKHVMNHDLESSYLLHFPIIDSQYIPKNNTYYITFTKTKPVVEKKETEPTKLISWILGRNPYLYHTSKYTDQNNLLYELRISNDGSFQFLEPED